LILSLHLLDPRHRWGMPICSLGQLGVGWRFASFSTMESEETVEGGSMATLEIVWRNPNPAQYRRRWQPVRDIDGRVTYLIQEFACRGLIGYWSTISHLEVLRGRRVACPIPATQNCVA
jgi:hypothetical protein